MKLPGALSKLDEEQHSYLISLLSMGRTDTEIAAAITEKGWLPDVKKQTLLKNVNRWRRGKGSEAVMKELVDRFQTAPTKMKRQIDVMEEMTELALKQKKRVAKLEKQENVSPLLLQSVTDELKFLLTSLEKLANAQMKTGILRTVKVGETEDDYVDAKEEDGEQQEIFTEEDRRLLQIVNTAAAGATLQ